MKYTLQLQIAKDFINKILCGELSEGDILPSEMELVSIYSTSRSTVREAMKILSTRNIVQSKQRAGTKVLSQTQWNILDPIMIYLVEDPQKLQNITSDFAHMRTIIEADVVLCAIDNMSDEGKEDLAEAFQNLASLSIEDNTDEFASADFEFHKIIYENSNNHVYSSLCQIFQPIWLNEIHMVLEHNYKGYIADHKKIYDAIINGDKSNIPELISSHVQMFKRYYPT